MTNRSWTPLGVEHFHAVDTVTCKQTMVESELEYSVKMGDSLTIHHGSRYGAPIVIAENHSQEPDELSGIWYQEGQ